MRRFLAANEFIKLLSHNSLINYSILLSNANIGQIVGRNPLIQRACPPPPKANLIEQEKKC